ncbi:hypothetical protein KKA69_01940 [Patescibacteria group bacterium]|nr:hypothetical protein [Patescibacteria group bacterium]
MKKQLTQLDFKTIQEAIPSLRPVFKPVDDETSTASKVGDIINIILPYLFIIAGLLLFFYLIAAGFQMMTSPGDEKAAASAKAKITNALAGFVILFVSFWLVKLLGYILGLELL